MGLTIDRALQLLRRLPLMMSAGAPRQLHQIVARLLYWRTHGAERCGYDIVFPDWVYKCTRKLVPAFRLAHLALARLGINEGL